jgi:hypothetical protein
MSLRLLTRYSGTAHIKATHDAEIFKSIFGLENKILSNGDNLEITVAAGTGTVTIGTGAFSFCGRVGIVDSDITATYARPASDTIYAKIGVAFKYERNTETNIETISAVALKSAEVASAALAAAESIEYGGTTPMTQIDSSSTEAYFIVGEFIANASAISGLEYKTEVLKSVAELAELETKINAAYEYVEGATPVLVLDYHSVSTSGDYITLSLDTWLGTEYDYLIIDCGIGGIVKERWGNILSDSTPKYYLPGTGNTRWLTVTRVGTTHDYRISIGATSLSGSTSIYVYKSKY